ncbi:hypothetical protein SK128_023365 [Halocaridina rubra]|uniref:Uncharacterized protein n=1 Tax=Halocaridina rubra TaxID=373956 RepID=A0AAN8ZWB5_HALRR
MDDVIRRLTVTEIASPMTMKGEVESKHIKREDAIVIALGSTSIIEVIYAISCDLK